MPKIKSPGVYVEEVPGGLRPIVGVATSIAAFAGWSPEGPTDHAQLISSWVEYERYFGGFDKRGLLAYSVHHFFNNGGRWAYILRLTADSHRTVLKPNTSSFESALLPKNGRGGLYLLDRVDLFNLLCVPGETIPVIISRLQKFCRDRRAFLIVDCDQTATVSSLRKGPDPTITD
jgi:hypothetical protein